MSAELYDVVHGLAQAIVNAAAAQKHQAAGEAYDVLKELCVKNEGGDLDHPLQWEALGDFSENHEESLQAYQKGLLCASNLNLLEYCASIKFAMAERYFEHENLQKAQQLAHEASVEALSIEDNELTMAITELLYEIEHS